MGGEFDVSFLGAAGPQVTAEQVGIWVGVLLILLSGAVSVVNVFVALRRKPPIEAEFVSKTDCEKFRGALDDSSGAMSESISGMVTRVEFTGWQSRMDSQMGQMRDHIDSVGTRLTEKLDEVKTDLGSMDERRAIQIHNRLNFIEASVARIDERTKGVTPKLTT